MAQVFEVIIPKPLNKKVLLEVGRETVEEIIDEADKEFAKTYKTFNRKPKFDKSLKENSRQTEGVTETSGDGSSDNPYPFTARGTSVRYATMSQDFVAKTTPNVIDSKSGRGGALFVDRRRPRPGIVARNFEPIIAKQEQPKFKKLGQVNLNKAAKKSGHAI